MTSRDLYFKAIKEMYPDVVIGRLSSNMAFHEDWAATRAVAALKAFTTVKSMISNEKLVYDDRTSLSDDDDSDECSASNVHRKPKKRIWTMKTRSSLLLYHPVMQCFLHLIPRMP